MSTVGARAPGQFQQDVDVDRHVITILGHNTAALLLLLVTLLGRQHGTDGRIEDVFETLLPAVSRVAVVHLREGRRLEVLDGSNVA